MLTSKKLIVQTSVGLLLLAAAGIVCAMIGTRTLSFSAVLNHVDPDAYIFYQIRLPRILLAMIVGAALACSGAVFQVLLRNPLADPYILGISSGAGLGAIMAILLEWTRPLFGLSPVAAFAFAGAMLTILLVWKIGRYTGRMSGPGLLLAGVVVNAFFSAVIMFFTSIAQPSKLQSTLFWLMGYLSVYEKTSVLLASTVIVLAGIIVIFLLSPKLNILSLGSAEAQTLGVYPERTFLIAFSAAALITAVAVSLSGLVGFVGLIVPHALRLMFGPDHRRLIPFCAIGGAIFVALADTAARVVVAPAQLPAGVLTALAGGPFFLLLLVRSGRRLAGGR